MNPPRINRHVRIARPPRQTPRVHPGHKVAVRAGFSHGPAKFLPGHSVAVGRIVGRALVSTPAAEVDLGPQSQISNAVRRPQNALTVRYVQVILVHWPGQEGPHGERPVRYTVLESLLHRVAQERAEQTGV